MPFFWIFYLSKYPKKKNVSWFSLKYQAAKENLDIDNNKDLY